MPTITISDDTAARLKSFERVGRAIMGDAFPIDELVEVLALIGIRETLNQLWSTSPDTIPLTLEKLSIRHHEIVHGLIADALEAGEVKVGDEQKSGWMHPLLSHNN